MRMKDIEVGKSYGIARSSARAPKKGTVLRKNVEGVKYVAGRLREPEPGERVKSCDRRKGVEVRMQKWGSDEMEVYLVPSRMVQEPWEDVVERRERAEARRKRREREKQERTEARARRVEELKEIACQLQEHLGLDEEFEVNPVEEAIMIRVPVARQVAIRMAEETAKRLQKGCDSRQRAKDDGKR